MDINGPALAQAAMALAEKDRRIAELEAELAPLEGRQVSNHVKYTQHLEQEVIRLKAENQRLRDLLKRTIPKLIEVARMPNIEYVADGHNAALSELQAALAEDK